MNIATAAPLFAAWLNHHCARRNWEPVTAGQRTADVAGESRRQAMAAITALWIGIVLGLALAGIMWWQGDRGLFSVLDNFRYKLFWGVGELVFFVGCMLVYLKLHDIGRRPTGSRRIRLAQTSLAILAATNLMYHFPPLFAVMSRAAADPASIPARVGAAEFRELMAEGHVAALSIHFALASIAVAGVELLNRSARCITTVDVDESKIAWTKVGRCAAGVSLAVTAIQLLVGIWLLTQVPPLAQRAMMGGDILATSLLGGSIVGTLTLLHLLAAAAFGEVNTTRGSQCRALLMLIVVMMTGTLAWTAP